jgi:hypothetical protein
MSSSEETGPADEAAVAADAEVAGGTAGGSDSGQVTADADSVEPRDAWFTPKPADRHASNGAAQAEWFLPAGRAGLLPDSMTVSSADDGQQGDEPDHQLRAETVGAPPWAGEAAGSDANVPPPWESGPWPGPGEPQPAPASGTVPTVAVDGGGQRGPVHSGGERGPVHSGDDRSEDHSAAALLSPRTVLIAGLVPLVIPGLVLGFLSLRRARSVGSGQLVSWLAIAISLAWAVVWIVVAGSGSAGSCAGNTAAVQRAYAKVMADFGDHATAQVLAADLDQAASQANAAAAAAGQPVVRSALFAMAGDLEQARADATANMAIPASLRQHLAADGSALTDSCGN